MDLKQIKELIDMVNNSKLEKLKIETKDMKISLTNAGSTPAVGTPIVVQSVPAVGTHAVSMPVEAASVVTAAVPTVAPDAVPSGAFEVSGAENYKYITSPLVGIFKSLEAAKKSAVKVGDKVNSGDSVCVVEAMKLINEIESEFNGEIVEILVQEGDTVEFGQKLFAIK